MTPTPASASAEDLAGLILQIQQRIERRFDEIEKRIADALPPQPLIDRSQAAEALGISLSTLRRRVEMGQLPRGRKAKGARGPRWTREELGL